MDIHQKEVSLKFYNFLCDTIGSKNVVNKRRHIFAVKESRLENVTLLSSGSKAEGLDLEGSDFDLMIICNKFIVFEKIQKVNNVDGKIPLLMNTENTKPGFTNLSVHLPRRICDLFDFVDNRKGFPYLSSTLFRLTFCDAHVDIDPGSYIHGPCTTSSDGGMDVAVTLHSTDWISQALPWICRSKYSWACDKVLHNILAFGVLFVPIGSKNSKNADLEWRIYFSYAEKQLIFCFNHVQFLCYALLKILLTDIVKKTFGDLLCSYFMKTLMFWLCEETEKSHWRAENMLSCFMTCFQRLIYCVENETCLHYFIPENNLFENRFENQHSKLLITLKRLYNLGWTCLLETETLQSFRNYMQPSLLSNASILTRTSYPVITILDMLVYENFDHATLMKTCIYQSLRSKKYRDIYMFVISDMCQFSAQKGLDGTLVQSNNKVVYTDFRERLSYILIGVNNEPVSRWLLLASFFYTNRQYIIAKKVIDHCLTKFTPKRNAAFSGNVLTLQNVMEVQNLIGLGCLKKYTTSLVRIRENSSIIPNELKSFIENDSYIAIPSLLYAHFLNFLFYHTVGDEREKRRAYYKLKFLNEQYEYVVNNGQRYRSDMCLHVADNLMQYNSCNGQ